MNQFHVIVRRASCAARFQLLRIAGVISRSPPRWSSSTQFGFSPVTTRSVASRCTRPQTLSKNATSGPGRHRVQDRPRSPLCPRGRASGGKAISGGVCRSEWRNTSNVWIFCLRAVSWARSMSLRRGWWRRNTWSCRSTIVSRQRQNSRLSSRTLKTRSLGCVHEDPNCSMPIRAESQ